MASTVSVFFHPLKRHFFYITNTATQWESQCARLNTIKRYSISRTQALQMTSSCILCQSQPLKSCSFSSVSSPERFKYNILCWPQFIIDQNAWDWIFVFGLILYCYFLWVFCWWSFTSCEGLTLCSLPLDANDPFLAALAYSKPIWTVNNFTFFALQTFREKELQHTCNFRESQLKD